MPTQTVSPETTVAVLDRARDLTDAEGTFTVTAIVDWTQKSESTVRAAVAQLLTDGAVERADGRGQYRVVTTAEKPVDVSAAKDGDVLELPDGHKLGVVTDDAQHATTEAIEAALTAGEQAAARSTVGDTLAREAHDQDPANAGLGYVVYAVGANGQQLALKRTGTWVLTTDEELANFKAATDLPVSGWAGDKRRAITELRVYVTGSPLSSEPVHVAKPQELKKARQG